jgi:hypothetical protein
VSSLARHANLSLGTVGSFRLDAVCLVSDGGQGLRLVVNALADERICNGNVGFQSLIRQTTPRSIPCFLKDHLTVSLQTASWQPTLADYFSHRTILIL